MKKIAVLIVLAFLLAVIAGCGSSSDETATVQSVANICGIGSTTNVERYAGVVESKSETKIQKDEDKTVAEIKVAVGDTVDEGQVLFTYDKEQLALSADKLQIEIDQLKSAVSSKQSEIASLEKLMKSASGDDKTSYSLQIQELNADITEAGFTITSKEKDLEQMRSTLEDLDVKSPVAGKIQSINTQRDGEEAAFIVIRETGDFRVKGYVNETNRSTIFEGMEVLVRSRVDETVRKGTIKTIDLKNPSSSGGYDVYLGDSEDDTSSSSKYPFYIELSESDGFIIGQHVYIEPDYGQSENASEVIALPSYYINDADSGAWVWAQGKNEKLEKRSVELGDYDEMLDTYVILSGLDEIDYITYPDEGLHSGMKCVIYDASADIGDDIQIGDPEGYYYFDGSDDTDVLVFEGAGVPLE